MHSKIPVGTNTRCFAENALALWEAQQIKTLEAIDVQIQKTLEGSKKELDNMTRYLSHADKVLAREEEIREKTCDVIPEEESATWSMDICNAYNPVPANPIVNPEKNTVRRRLESAKAFQHECPAEVESNAVKAEELETELEITVEEETMHELETSGQFEGEGKSVEATVTAPPNLDPTPLRTDLRAGRKQVKK